MSDQMAPWLLILGRLAPLFLKFLIGMETIWHLAEASSLCGACKDACHL